MNECWRECGCEICFTQSFKDPGSFCWCLHLSLGHSGHLQDLAGGQMGRERERDGAGERGEGDGFHTGFHEPGLEVAHSTSTHFPLPGLRHTPQLSLWPEGWRW